MAPWLGSGGGKEPRPGRSGAWGGAAGSGLAGCARHALEPSGEGSGDGREGGDELEWDALGFSNLLYRNIIVNGPHVIAKWVTHRVTGMGYSRMHPHPLHPMGEVFTH
jgi:hypothetical protein